MINSFYTASTGVIELKKGLDVIANNIANVNTDGYKVSKSTFSDLLYTNIHAPEGTISNLKSGNGAKLAKTDTVFSQGPLKASGRTLDYALVSDGFFAVQTAEGVKYTRNGNFRKAQIGDEFYLVSMQGDLVLDKNGDPIEVKNDTDVLDIGVFAFENNDGLMRDGQSYFIATENAGEVNVLEKPDLKQGYLEGSGVDVAEEMSRVIESQRAFQFNSRIVQISDELMQTINSLR